jgi:hypothetical protein
VAGLEFGQQAGVDHYDVAAAQASLEKIRVP